MHKNQKHGWVLHQGHWCNKPKFGSVTRENLMETFGDGNVNIFFREKWRK